MVANTENINSFREKKAQILPGDPEILTLDQAGELLGVGRNAMYRLVELKRIPCRRVGKEYRFKRSALLAWLEG